MEVKDVSSFHQYITDGAVELANAHPNKHPQFTFHNASTDSTKTHAGIDGIKLEWDREGGLSNFPPEERLEIIERMNRIGQIAVKKSLVDNQDLLLGVMLGEARQGRDYFDHFRTDPEQLQLF